MGSHENVVSLPQPQQSEGATHPARALLGWIRPEEALALLTGGQQPTPEQHEQVTRARRAVASRAPAEDRVEAVQFEVPELQPAVERLRAHPATKDHFSAGWQVGLVDLAAVRSFQPCVLTEHAAARVADAEPGDFIGLANITLPTIDTHELPVKLVQGRTWMITSSDLNLHVLNPYFGLPVPGAPPVLGFHVSPTTSLVFIVEYAGRLFLRDGYHRSVGFLARGISKVPAFVRSTTEYDDLGVRDGMLPHDAFLGDRPPFLTDFFEDDVAAEVRVAAAEKLILVQAHELTPPI